MLEYLITQYFAVETSHECQILSINLVPIGGAKF